MNDYDEGDMQEWLSLSLTEREAGDPIPANIAVRVEWFERECGLLIGGEL
jgi:hypothetical protein